METNKEVLINKYDELRQHCWNEAAHAFGTAYIFEQRAINLRKKLRILTFLGFAVPITLGGIVASFGTTGPTGTPHITLPYLIYGAGVLGIIQLVISIWSLVAKWNDNLCYADESCAHNYRLSSTYLWLAKTAPSNFEARLEMVESENQQRTALDYKQDITEKEKRRGMRAALREFERACAACKTIPRSMNPTKCDVCGNF